MHRTLPIVLSALVAVWTGAAGAKDLFSTSISIDSQSSVRIGTNKARNIPDLFGFSTLSSIDPTYVVTDGVDARLNLRGLESRVSYAPGSTALRLHWSVIG